MAHHSEAHRLQSAYDQLREELQPQIDALQAEADPLAVSFKELYAAAREAYASGDGAGAKSLKEAGFPIEQRCRTLNAQANQLRERLKRILDEINENFEKSKRLEKEAESLKAKAESLRQTRVIGFVNAKLISEAEVEAFMDDFPQKIFEKIEAIQYYDTPRFAGNRYVLGTTSPPGRGKATISLYQHADKTFLKLTLTHEIGHVVFEHFMTDQQRNQWVTLYERMIHSGRDFITSYAAKNAEENFCECLAYYKLQPSKLNAHGETEYNLIKNILRKLGT